MKFEISHTSSYRPPVTKHIQSMIEKYNAKSLLKEFLQNADDAGATQLNVTLDLRNHGCFQEPKFNIASGPALVISNNAPFTERDFKAIDQIMDGNKVDNAQSTGRFGQGFTSSFSVSDHPSLFSGGMYHGTSKWFDVHESAVCEGLNNAVATWKHDEIKPEFYPILKEWLNVFLLPGEEDTIGRTVFRLPLRTVETAKRSQISQQIFDIDNFYEWCDEWRKHSDNLLFLRNVHTLVLSVVDKDGSTQELLKIDTKNIEKVLFSKNKIKNAITLDQSPKEICENWLSNSQELPTEQYEHELFCQYYDRNTLNTVSYSSKWAVVNGLFRGENDVLIKQALEVLNITPNCRKVLPWAGIAIQLESSTLHVYEKGRFFTFLPLDIETQSKVHIHGWLELDDKRTTIVLKAGNDDQKLLVDWNLMLIEHAVGKAWAKLLLKYKNILKTENYYKFWPSYNLKSDLMFYHLNKGFYEHMAKSECLKILYKDQTYWESPSENNFLCSKKEHPIELQNIVQKQLKLIYPQPQKNIIDHLNYFGGITSKITPEVLINAIIYSTKDIEFPAKKELLSDVFFANDDNISHVLKYVAKSENGVSDLVGLPLEFRLDSKLHKIQEISLFSDKPNLIIFKDDKSIFIDTVRYHNITDNEKPNTWLNPTLKNQLKVLSEMMTAELVDLDWINEIVDLLRRFGEDERHTKEIKQLLALLPLYKEQGFDPITNHYNIYLESKLDRDNREYYEYLGIPLYEESWVSCYQEIHDLMMRYSPIQNITKEVILNYIVNMDEEIKSNLTNIDFRHFILNFIDKINFSVVDCKNQIEKIKKTIPLALTQNGSLVTVSNDDRGLYLPGGFKVDNNLSQINDVYDLIHSDEEDFFNAFVKLDVTQMSFYDYIKNVVVPYLYNSNDVTVKSRILTWLCESIESIKSDDNVISILSNTNIIPSDRGGLLKPSELYLPKFFESLPKSLKETVEKPIVIQHSNWGDFLDLCGAKKNVSLQHLFMGAEYISKNNDIDESHELIKFISKHLSEFEKLAKNNAGLHKRILEIQWIPCSLGIDVIDDIKNSKLYLKTANDIVNFPLRNKLCPSFNLISSEIKKEIGNNRELLSSLERFLELKKHPELDLQIRNYSQLSTIPKSSKNIEFIEKASIELYLSLGKSNKKAVELNKIFINKEWVNIRNTFFCSTFSLPGLYSVNSYLCHLKQQNQDEIRSGLQVLGVKDCPSKEFLINYMESNLGLESSLTEDKIDIAKSVLYLLENQYFESINKDIDIPLLTTEGKLFKSSKVLIDDGDELKNATSKNNHLRVCVSELNQLASKTNARSIKHNAIFKINKDETRFLSDHLVPDSISNFSRKLKATWFENAVRRLAFNNSKSSINEIEKNSNNHRLIPDNITICESLMLSCNIGMQWIYDTDKHKVFNIDDKMYVVNGTSRMFCEALASYVSDRFAFDSASSIIISTLIKDIESEEEADKYLGEEKGIPELPKEIKLQQPNILKEVMDQENTKYPVDANQQEDTDSSDMNDLNIIDLPNNRDKFSFDQNRDKLSKSWSPQSEHICSTKPTTKVEPHTNGDVCENKAYNAGSKKDERTNHFQPLKEIINKEVLGDATHNVARPLNSGAQISRENGQRRPLDIPYDGFVSNNNKSGVGNYFTENQAILLGDSGVNTVKASLELDLPSGYTIQKMPENNPGYDLKVLDSNGDVVRKIEVKTLSGEWGERGVGLSRTQVELALSDSTWSLIIVIGQNTDQTRFIELGNPFDKIEKYFLPNQWNRDFLSGMVEILPLDLA